MLRNISCGVLWWFPPCFHLKFKLHPTMIAVALLTWYVKWMLHVFKGFMPRVYIENSRWTIGRCRCVDRSWFQNLIRTPCGLLGLKFDKMCILQKKSQKMFPCMANVLNWGFQYPGSCIFLFPPQPVEGPRIASFSQMLKLSFSAQWCKQRAKQW